MGPGRAGLGVGTLVNGAALVTAAAAMGLLGAAVLGMARILSGFFDSAAFLQALVIR